jgi:hypothetical protein
MQQSRILLDFLLTGLHDYYTMSLCDPPPSGGPEAGKAYGRNFERGPMTTEAQVAANRVNAQKSTGPRTTEGRAAVTQNAVKHGLRAQAVVLPGEDCQEYARYHGQMREQLQPADVQEIELAERIVSLSWRLRRAGRYHDAVFEALYDRQVEEMAAAAPQAPEPDTSDRVLGRMLLADFSGDRVLERVQLYERRIENSLSRVWAEWRALRAQPRQPDQCRRLPSDGAGDLPAVATPDGVPGALAANRPGSLLCQTKPIGPESAHGNNTGWTNKPNRDNPAAGAAVNKQSQWQPPAVKGLGLGSANEAHFRAPVGILAALSTHKRLPRQCAM